MNFLRSLYSAAPVLPLDATNRQWASTLSGLDSLTFAEAEVPKPKDGEVLVKIRAVALNYRDTEGKGVLMSRLG